MNETCSPVEQGGKPYWGHKVPSQDTLMSRNTTKTIDAQLNVCFIVSMFGLILYSPETAQSSLQIYMRGFLLLCDLLWMRSVAYGTKLNNALSSFSVIEIHLCRFSSAGLLILVALIAFAIFQQQCHIIIFHIVFLDRMTNFHLPNFFFSDFN